MDIAEFARPLAAVIIGCCTGAALAQQPFIYPTKGQSQQQTEFDKGQCYTWAVQQTGYDPANPPPPPPPPPAGGGGSSGDQVAQGIFGGGLLGAGIGAISGHAGEGAAIGALFGGLRRASMAQQQQQQQQQQQMAYAQQQQAAQSQGLYNYQRAFKACMNGRGYTVE